MRGTSEGARMTTMVDELRSKLQGAVVEDPERGIYRARRDVFTDPDLFELEMRHIFEGNWIYLAHETQLTNNNDYLTMWMGRQPVIISRDRKGQLHAVLNACAHRGAMVCRRAKDNRSTWTCPFHGWTYSNDGRLLKVKEAKGAGYPEGFNTNGSHDMPKVPRFESYRGFLFGSLNPDVLSLEQHLGETTKLIDMMVDASDEGLEVLRGASTYTYDGNWKVQAENGADGYHVASVHWNYAATTARRASGESVTETRAMDAGSYGKTKGGFYAFDNGHVLLWTTRANPEDEPLYERRDELVQKFGQAKADWMINVARNLCIYPNVYLMDQFSSQIRQYHPIAVDKTEVTIHCIAPKGESDAARTARIRRYEDFFNATGMATPDDLEEFRSSHKGFLARNAPWNDMSRGATHWIKGPDDDAKALGINPVLSGARVEDEGLYPVQHGYWLKAMRHAVDLESKAAAR
jgi:benzoate/toluate 1,2-dioxygenase alpha subunit